MSDDPGLRWHLPHAVERFLLSRVYAALGHDKAECDALGGPVDLTEDQVTRLFAFTNQLTNDLQARAEALRGPVRALLPESTKGVRTPHWVTLPDDTIRFTTPEIYMPAPCVHMDEMGDLDMRTHSENLAWFRNGMSGKIDMFRVLIFAATARDGTPVWLTHDLQPEGSGIQVHPTLRDACNFGRILIRHGGALPPRWDEYYEWGLNEDDPRFLPVPGKRLEDWYNRRVQLIAQGIERGSTNPFIWRDSMEPTGESR